MRAQRESHNMNIEFIPKIASIPRFCVYYINLSETIKTDVMLMFLKKSAQETDFVELSDETSSDEQILVICDNFEETDAFFKEHEQFQSAHILLTDTLFKPTSAQQLLKKRTGTCCAKLNDNSLMKIITFEFFAIHCVVMLMLEKITRPIASDLFSSVTTLMHVLNNAISPIVGFILGSIT